MARFGRYEVGEVLGEGGAGRVYAAELVGPGGSRKPVALKILVDRAGALRREARIGGLLRHRHLVDVFEVGEVDGQWFCALELCTLGALSAYAPLPPRAVVEVGLQVCAALHYAQDELGLVHLDLKPDNLLVAADGTVKVADLGIARARGFDADPGVRGTPGYMPPEQARGDAVDTRADIFALGRTLQDLATGRRGADHTLSLTLETLPSADARSPSAPAIRWLEPVSERCLAPDPDDRWRSLADLAAALHTLDPDGPGLREALGLPVHPSTAPRRADTNIPEGRDAFVGREVELASLADRLGGPCLVTLKGPIGIGKTRLAEEAARRWRARHGGAAWLCDLSGCRAPDGVVTVVAQCLDVPLAGGDLDATATQLGHALASHGAALLVLDNVAQLGDARALVERWIGRAPQLRVVLTSLEPLRLPTEEVFAVDVLPTADAVRLLMARARQRGVEIDRAAEVEELVQRLDGVPLAVELAAGRLGVLSVRDILDRLGLSLLRRGTEGRHATLSAALAWSWELLTADERSALAQLTVFSGGFTLEAADEVLRLPDATVLDVLGSLVDRSMVRVVSDTRFELLSSVAEFASSRLESPGEAVRRHGQHFATYGTPDALEALHRHGGLDAARALAPEVDNLVRACRLAVARGDAQVALGTLRGVTPALMDRAPEEVLVSLALQVRGMTGCAADQEADAAVALGEAYRMTGKMSEAERELQVAFRIRSAGGDPIALADCRVALAGLYGNQSRHAEALALYTEALATYRSLGDRRASDALRGLGNVLRIVGDLPEARRCFEASLRIVRECGNLRGVSDVVGSLGLIHYSEGRLEEARPLLTEAIAVQRALGGDRHVIMWLSNLGSLERTAGRHEAATGCFIEALALARRLGHRRAEAVLLINTGALHFDRCRLESARAKRVRHRHQP